MKRILIIFAAGVLLAAVPAAVAADKKDREETAKRSVEGAVTDGGENAVVGAVVQLKNLKTLQIRSFITKANGQYQFQGLSPDIDYELRAEHQGSSSGPKTLSSFDGRKQAILNLKISKN